MSQIFDALQRWEADYSGTSESARPGATELLARAERYAAAQWRRDHGAKNHGGNGNARPRGPIPASQLILEVPETESTAPASCEQPTPGDGILGEFAILDPSQIKESRLVALTDRESAAAEAFRLLSVRLQQVRRDRILKRVLITSTVPQEGKSVTAANLACTLAAGGQQNVLLLEGDVRRPAITEILRLKALPGLSELLQDRNSMVESINRIGESGPWVLGAGAMPENPLELIQSPRLPALMHHLSSLFDWIIMDSPPVLPMADTSVWVRLADGILLVARPGISQKQHLQRGIQALDASKLIGAVMNSTSSSDAGYYHYYGRRPGTSPDDARQPD